MHGGVKKQTNMENAKLTAEQNFGSDPTAQSFFGNFLPLLAVFDMLYSQFC